MLEANADEGIDKGAVFDVILIVEGKIVGVTINTLLDIFACYGNRACVLTLVFEHLIEDLLPLGLFFDEAHDRLHLQRFFKLGKLVGVR